FDGADLRLELMFLLPRPLDLSLVTVEDRDRHAEVHAVLIARARRRALAVEFAADRVIDLALGDLQADIGRRSRLIAPHGLNVGPQPERAVAQHPEIQPVGAAAEIADEVDGLRTRAADPRLQPVARDDE